MKNTYPEKTQEQVHSVMGEDRLLADKPISEWDVAALLKLMWDTWNSVFRNILGTS